MNFVFSRVHILSIESAISKMINFLVPHLALKTILFQWSAISLRNFRLQFEYIYSLGAPDQIH